MPKPIALPDCLMIAFRTLFPTIDFSRVTFHLGLPWFTPASADGITLPGALGTSDIDVYINDSHLCGRNAFLLLAHELVHALQIQDSGRGLGFLRPFTLQYSTCFVLGAGTKRGNPLEREAYDYANGSGEPGDPPGRLATCIDSNLLPCDCSGLPWRGFRPTLNFSDTLLTRCPDLPKSHSTAGGGCIGPGDLSAKLGTFGQVLDVVLTVAKVVVAIAIAVVLVIVAIVAAIISVLGSVVNWISDQFSSEGYIRLMFTNDPAAGFDTANAVTLPERSSQPPALTSDAGHVYLGWTDTDDHLNVFAVPDPPPRVTFEQSAGGAGPSLTFATDKVLMGWQDPNNVLRILSSPPLVTGGPNLSFLHDGRALTSRHSWTLAGQSSPAITFGANRFYAGWIDEDHDNHIFLFSSPDLDHWQLPIDTQERSSGGGTPALAIGFDRLFLAWVGLDGDHHINVKSFAIQDNGEIGGEISKVTLDQRGTGDAGPALAFGVHSVHGPTLYLAWVDPLDHLRFMYTFDPELQSFSGYSYSWEGSSDDAGPAICVGPGDLVTVAEIVTFPPGQTPPSGSAGGRGGAPASGIHIHWQRGGAGRGG